VTLQSHAEDVTVMEEASLSPENVSILIHLLPLQKK